MKVKSLAVLSILFAAILSILPVPVKASSSNGYELLIIAPDEFMDALQPLRNFKDATNRPTILMSLEDIYSNHSFDGADEAEEVKKYIAYCESVYGIQYVMLVGDCDKFPMRAHYMRTENETHVNWVRFYVTDHYYADLYNENGDFCDWDSNKNGFYGECTKIFPYEFENVDHVDFHLDVAVGRVPASSVSEVNAYVNKIIQYETTTSPDSSWFKRALLLTGTNGGRYEPNSDIAQNDNIASRLVPLGFEMIKLYDESGYVSPNPTRINEQLNQGVGLVNVVSHADNVRYSSWCYCYDVTTDMIGLNNAETLPMIYSFGCDAAHFGPVVCKDEYIDVDGVLQTRGYTFPCLKEDFVEPPKPSVLQNTYTDTESMPEYWLVKHDMGAIAFIGSTAEAIAGQGYPINSFFFESFAEGKRTLGDIWQTTSEKYLAAKDPWHNREDFRRWLFMNLFGDPSLVVGGLPSESVVTTTNYRYFDMDPDTHGQQFRLLFTPDPENPSKFRLTASNPGQFYYNIFHVGTLSAGDQFTMTLPYPFETQGANPVHVYSSLNTNPDGYLLPQCDISDSFDVFKTTFSISDYTDTNSDGIVGFGDEATITVSYTSLTPYQGLAYITIHVDYGLKKTGGYQKGVNDNALNTLNIDNYSDHEFSVSGKASHSQIIKNINVFKHDPGFAGIVTDSVDNPIESVTVRIFDPNGNLIAILQTDENGFYSYHYKHRGLPDDYTVEIKTQLGYTETKQTLLKANKFVVVNFQIP